MFRRTTYSTYNVSISYSLPCKLHKTDDEDERVTLSSQVRKDLYNAIRKMRTRAKLSDADILSHFMSDDFGLVRIEYEKMDFKYDSPESAEGILKVSYVLLVNVDLNNDPRFKNKTNVTPTEIFNHEFILKLCYDAFNPCMDDETIVEVVGQDMVLEALDIPQKVKSKAVLAP